MRLRLNRRREVTAVLAALPDVLERVAGGLRSGAAPAVAVADAAAGADLPASLAADLTQIAEGSEEDGFETALSTWAAHRPLPAIRATAAALSVAARAGGPAGPALEGLVGGLRDRQDATGEMVALSAQARLSALVVGSAPLVSLSLSLFVDRRVAPALFGTPAGRTCLLVGLGTELVAALWMRRIVRCEP